MKRRSLTRRQPSPSHQRIQFGQSWWGRAWIEALEKRARLDPNRLPRGRTYARTGAVEGLIAIPGEARAKVHGSRARPYDVRVRVRRFEDAEWEVVLDTIAAQAGHAAALLDGELAPAIVDHLREAGVELLPEAGEVVPACSCPDWANPCKHAAAVAYLVAQLLDQDPFQILLLRGRARDQVLSELRRRRAAVGTTAELAQAEPPLVIPARQAYSDWRDRTPPELPVIPAPPRTAGQPAFLATEPPHGIDVVSADLHELAADAALRAWELCHGLGDGGLTLDVDTDLARRAAGHLDDRFQDFAFRVGAGRQQLAREARAWAAGGLGALQALHEAWDPPAADLDEGVAALGDLGLQGIRRWRNRLSAATILDRQLRFGRDGLWYGVVMRGREWEIEHAPDPDPKTVLERLGLAVSGAHIEPGTT